MRTNTVVSTLLAISFTGAASASVAGAQGLYAKNYLLAADGSAQVISRDIDGKLVSNAFYSVMDVYLKFNSATGTGSNGERVVNFFGQATTDSSTYGVTKSSKYENSAGLAFQHNNTSWLPASGNNTWDSFLTVGARTQGAGNAGNVTPDTYFTNPNSNVGSIVGGSNSNGIFVGAGVYQAAPTDAGWETNASANADHLILFGRFTLKCSDITSENSVKMAVWCDFVGKSAAQTGGTTLYTIASANLKSDAQTKYTTSSKVWTFDSSFEGAGNPLQSAWTFAPTPGAAALVGLAALLTGRRRN